MIARRLREWHPRPEIREGESAIARVRMLAGETGGVDTGETLFAGPAGDFFPGVEYQHTALLVHRDDRLFFPGRRPAEVMNGALAALDFYNSWEQAVLEAAEAEDPFQRIVDLSDPVLENPAMLLMLDGSLVAWTKRYEYEQINPLWVHLMKHKTPPPFFDYTAPNTGEWTFEPAEYRTVQGNILGFYLAVAGEPVATFTVSEYGRPFEPCDVQCLRVLNEIFSHIAATRRQSPIRPNAAVLAALLNGEEPERPLLNQLSRTLPPPPWVILVFRAMENSNTRILRSALDRQLQQFTGVAFSLDYGGAVVALCVQETMTSLEKEIKNHRLHEHWQIGVSLPFSEWTGLHFRYGQALFAIEQGVHRSGRREINGFWLCRDYAFEQIMAVMSEDSRITELLHPAVSILERYDTEHNASLGETLLCYLAHERNTTLTAEILHLHRNSLLHRIERIETLTGAVLGNPAERAYIYFSYLVRGAEKKA